MDIKRLIFIVTCVIFISACQKQNDTAVLYKALINNTDGNPGGKITLVEFYDFNCHSCQRMAPIIKQVINDEPELRVVYKEYPVLGSNSEFAAKAVLAAKMQNRYLAYRQLLITSSKPLPKQNILSYAIGAQMEPKLLANDIDSPFVVMQYEAIQKLAKQWNVNKVPTFLIGVDGHPPVRLVGYQSATELEKVINRKL